MPCKNERHCEKYDMACELRKTTDPCELYISKLFVADTRTSKEEIRLKKDVSRLNDALAKEHNDFVKYRLEVEEMAREGREAMDNGNLHDVHNILLGIEDLGA